MNSEAKKKIFIALVPGAETQQQICKLTSLHINQTGGRVIPAPNLHLTLNFLGLQSNDVIHPLLRLLARLPFASFNLTLDRIGFWKRSGIIWLGCSRECHQLTELVYHYRDVVRALGIQTDTVTFVPLITLLRKARKKVDISFPPFTWQVNSPVLLWSRNTARGVEYQELRQAPEL